MKRIALPLLVLIACFPSRLASQDFQILVGGGDPAPIDIPIWTSALVDLTGYGLFAAPLFSVSDDARLTLSSIGAATMAVGGLGWNLSLDAKASHWKKEYDIDVSSADRKKSWNLTFWASGFQLGSAVVGIINNEDPGPEGYIISLVLGITGGVIELINIQGPRLSWMSDMAADYRIQSKETGFEPSLSPVIAASFLPSGEGSSLVFGLKLSI